MLEFDPWAPIPPNATPNEMRVEGAVSDGKAWDALREYPPADLQAFAAFLEGEVEHYREAVDFHVDWLNEMESEWGNEKPEDEEAEESLRQTLSHEIAHARRRLDDASAHLMACHSLLRYRLTAQLKPQSNPQLWGDFSAEEKADIEASETARTSASHHPAKLDQYKRALILATLKTSPLQKQSDYRPQTQWAAGGSITDVCRAMVPHITSISESSGNPGNNVLRTLRRYAKKGDINLDWSDGAPNATDAIRCAQGLAPNYPDLLRSDETQDSTGQVP